MPLPRLKPDHGPLLRYLKEIPEKDRIATIETIRTILQTKDGRVLVEAIENATEMGVVSIMADPGALADRHAQSFIASDLRRIADETDILDRIAQSHHKGPIGRDRGRRKE